MNKNYLAAIILAITSAAASAAEPAGFYMGADVGTTKVDYFGNENSYGVFAGYQFNQSFAAELGYRNMGKFRFYGIDADTKQAALSLLVSAPLGAGFSIYGRLGYNNLEVDVHGYSANDSGSLAGVGFGYAINPNVTARIEYQRPASDTQNVSFGVSYKF